MKLINIGFGSMVAANRLLAIDQYYQIQIRMFV